MTDQTTRQLKKRLLRRGIANMLAEPLSAPDAQVFLAIAEEDLNASHPSREIMKRAIRVVK